MSGATSRQFQAVVTVDDRTGAALAIIAARLRAIAGMSGMERVRAAALNLQRTFAGFAGSAARIGTVASVMGVGAGAGLAAMVRNAAEAAGEVGDLRDRLGIATGQIQAFRHAAEASGQSGQTFTQAMVALNRGISGVASGQNRELAGLFRRLGINVRDANGQIRTAAGILPQLAQAIMRNENPIVRQRIAMAAMQEAGAALMPMFTEGAAGLRRFTEEWQRYGYTFSDQDQENAKGYTDAVRRLTTSLRGMADAIGSTLMPIVTPLVQQLADWVRANRDLIATKIGEWARSFAEWLKGIDFGNLIEQARSFITSAHELFDRIGGWKTVGIAVAAYFTGPFVVALGVLAAAITTTLIPPLAQAVGLMARLGAAGFAGAAARLSPAAAALAPPAAGAAAAPAAAVARAGAGVAGAAAAPAAAAAAPAAGAATGAARLGAGLAGAAATGVAGVARALSAAVAGANLAGIAAGIGMVLGSAEDPEIRRRSRERMARGENGARRIEGFDDPDPDEQPAPGINRPLSRNPGGLPKLTPLYKPEPAAARPPAPAPEGAVKVAVRFENTPPGTRVQADTEGRGVRQPDIDVGFAVMGAGQ